ncbi:bifunctional folylpolyglutamate synthase/dihydrofolate synthase [Marixanthomonas ophiurae]|uniref:Dihydrofolate synthase/folylpolyglutamate synthase n=1 Tax=Marixanthomonas ophiurae TaxID=387659 RepID=A0A3E1Q9D2_9FLAO|nr:folylpolyglutamate synthase/dihydrofolate synthase family protein [Marixanthomonas ophiurae]RFN58724.1 bifunctional folylpolyglutamate synthase/dihydrofolate synthase [Marixanthomonas ophiurae]
MNYQQTIAWLFTQLPMYQRVGKTAFKKDLSNTLKLSKHLNNPEQNFKSIHVAGTNGKGSVSHMLASVLQEAGYKVGLYTSPHLKDFRERIKVNGQMIAEEKVISFVTNNKFFLEENKLSFFEMTVGLAFDYFSKQKVDIAVIEVGLGGRLDSTNIITPEVSVITNIGFDHTAFLGNTYTEIASEKAGIIKPNIPVVIGETVPDTKKVFQKIASEKDAFITFAENETISEYESDLKGIYQQKNKKTAVCALKVFQENGWHISEENICKGILNTVKNTGLQGRYQTLQKSPRVICDTAHNKEGLALVLQQIQEEPYENLHIVLGVVNDKDLDSILPLFPIQATYYFCKPDVPRGLEASILANTAKEFGLTGMTFNSINKAYASALENASENDLIYIGGSTFTVAEVV